jgi:hypothetical protein
MLSRSTNNCLFHKGQTIEHKQFPATYRVTKTPNECTHNNKPAYQLQQVLPLKTAPFFRDQGDVELYWKAKE